MPKTLHSKARPETSGCAKKLPQAFQNPPHSLQNHLLNICREFGQTWNRKPPNFERPDIALALRFVTFFTFRGPVVRTRFGRKLPVPFLWGLPGLPASRQKPPQTLQNHPSNPCCEFGQNWSRNPPNFRRPKIALALRFPLFFHFSANCFLVKIGAGTPLISGGRQSLWHYVFHCFFNFRRTVLRPRFGIYRHPFWTPFWAPRCSGLNVDAKNARPETSGRFQKAATSLPKAAPRPPRRQPKASTNTSKPPVKALSRIWSKPEPKPP